MHIKIEVNRTDLSGSPISISISVSNVDELSAVFDALKISSHASVDILTGAKDKDRVNLEIPEEASIESISSRSGHHNFPSPRTSEVEIHPNPSRRLCDGHTKKYKPCQNPIKAIPHSVEKQYCHHHHKSRADQNPSVAYMSSGYRVIFSDYIPHYLQDDTKTALMAEMQKEPVPNGKDNLGFIYVFEIIDATKDVMTFKVGMTTRTVETRLGEWKKQCRSKEWIPCGTWPPIDSKEDGDNKNNADNKGLNQPLTIVKRRVPFCNLKKLERLIHIELADLTVNDTYLEEGFPDLPARGPSISSSKLETPKKFGRRSSSSLSIHRQELQKCIDCGIRHQEEFSFKRLTRGPSDGQEWREYVGPIVERWGKFVEAAY